MDAHERRRRLLELARAEGHLSVADLAGRVSVSMETIRRDLAALEAGGLIRRSYGAAYPVETAGYETDLSRRQTFFLAEKQRLADEAVRHLDDAETVFIDEGYTPQLIAQRLPDRPLTIVTGNLPVAIAMAAREKAQVFVLGGRVRRATLGVVDHWSTSMLEHFTVDLAFVGANSISCRFGLATQDADVAAVKSAAMRGARRAIFVGISPKFSARSLCRFGAVSDLDLIISDRKLTETEAARLTAEGPSVIRV